MPRSVSSLLIAFALAVLAGRTTAEPAPDGRSLLVVANGPTDAISVVDVAPGNLRSTIRLGEAVGGKQLAISPDGSRAYIADPARATVRLWERTSQRVTASLSIHAPRDPLLHPDGSSLFLLSQTDAGDELVIADTSSLTVRQRIPLGGRAHIRFSTDRSLLFADVTYADESAALFRIDPTHHRVTGFMSVEGPVQRVVPGGSGEELYALRTSHDLWKNAAPVIEVEVLDAVSHHTRRRIPIESATGPVRLSPDDRFAFVGLGIDQVQQIDLQRGTLVTTYRIGNQYLDSAFNSAGNRLYILADGAVAIASIEDHVIRAKRQTSFPVNRMAGGAVTRDFIGAKDAVSIVDSSPSAPPGPSAKPQQAITVADRILPITGMVTDLQLTPDEILLYVLTDTAIATFDLTTEHYAGGTTEAFPTALAATPDGQTLYVLESNRNTVGVIDMHRGELVATLPALDSPSGRHTTTAIAVSADGEFAYIAYRDDLGMNGWIAVVDTNRQSIVETIPLFGDKEGCAPTKIVPTGDGTSLYLLLTQGDIGVLDLASRSLQERIRLTDQYNCPMARDMILGPDHQSLFVALQEPYASPGLACIDTASARVRQVPLDDPTPLSLAASHDGNTIFILQQSMPDSVISEYDTQRGKVIRTIPLPSGYSSSLHQPGFVLGDSGTTAFVTRESEGSIHVIDLSNGSLFRTIAVGGRPQGLLRLPGMVTPSP